MKDVIWECDKCGFRKTLPENADFEDVFSGWVTIHKYIDGECETIDLCPECTEELFGKN